MLAIKNTIIDSIKEKYNIVDILDLVEYDLDLKSMATKLYQYHNAIFSNDQRLIILHHDTDFYPSLNIVGNTIYNFLRLCANYQIPLDKIIFLTNHYGIEDEIKSAAVEICNDDSIYVIYTSQWADFPDIYNLQYNLQDSPIQFLYCCINGQRRQHRVMTLSMLQEHQLIDTGLVSYYFGN